MPRENSQGSNSFYKNQYFRVLADRLNYLEQKIEESRLQAEENYKLLHEKIDQLNSKMAYIYGFAGAIGMIMSFLGSWLKSKLMG